MEKLTFHEDDFHEYYSLPFLTEENFIYQYKVVIYNDIFSLYEVKNYECDDDDDDLEEYEEEEITHYIDIPLPNALIKMKNKLDLRDKDYAKFTEKDLKSRTLLELYDEFI